MDIMNIFNILIAAPEIFLTGVIAVVLLADLYLPASRRKVIFWLTLIGIGITAFIIIGQHAFAYKIGPAGHYVHDRLGDITKLGILFVGFFIFIYAEHYLESRKILRGEFYVLSLASILGMFILVSANSLLTIYLGLELLSLPLYALIAMQRDARFNTEAAMKYFVLGSLASALLLFGISIIYGATGFILLPEIANVVPQLIFADQKLLLAVGVVFLVAGIAFKLGAVPFHMWIPDVYSGAPTIVTTLIASASKLAGIVMAIRLLSQALGDLAVDWQPLCMVLAVLSLVIGNVVAIVQNDIKRLLGYSAIGHIGFIFLGLFVGTPEAYSAILFYGLVYAVMVTAAFGLLILIENDGVEVQTVEDLKGLAARNPWYAFLMLLTMFSLAGIPPLAGFYAKFLVLQALAENHSIWLVGIALFFSVIGAFYYLRIVKIMYFAEPDNPGLIQSPKHLRYAISVNTLVILALGIIPAPLIAWCQSAFM
jgi:NADH-quinone oxidoreductase subunit N